MKFFRKLFGLESKPEKEEVHPDIRDFGRILTGDEDECEYCHRPIFRDTEKWTKIYGHYYHRNCFQQGVKESKK